MLMLTRDATEAIRGLAMAPGAEGVRISTGPDPSPASPGPSFRIELVPAPAEEDAVLEAEGAKIFLAPEAAPALDDKLLDADVEDEGVRFAITGQTNAGPGS